MRRLGVIVLVCTAVATMAPTGCSSDRPLGFVGNDGGSRGEPLLPDSGAPVQQGECRTQSDSDVDGDGYTPAGGDCNDCDPNVNPGAFDVLANGLDEDCSGKPDDEPVGCDRDIPIDSVDPIDGARALGLCRMASTDAARRWGVVAARYVKPDLSPEVEPRSHGILPDLGPNFKPFEGARMLSLSSGFARRPDDLTAEEWEEAEKKYRHAAPPGFPHAPPACPDKPGGTPYDGAGLELTIRVPTNARSFTFSHAFFTNEYPDYYCSSYNDVYVVLMSPKVTRDGNIAFDREGNGVSVNSVLLDICQPTGGLPVPCKKGPALLEGTGFDAKSPSAPGTEHGATSWLTTSSPVKGGEEITLLFAIWDSADAFLDSTIIADDFRWSVEVTDTPVTRVR